MPPVRPRTRRRRQFVRWIIVGFIGIVIFSAFLLRVVPDSETNRRLEEIRAAGLPTNLHELSLWQPQVPDSSNAALLVIQAANQRVEPTAALDNYFPVPSPRGDLGGAKMLLQTHIEKNKGALELLHKAVALPSSRYTLNLSNTYAVQHLAQIKALTMLLKFESVHHHHRGASDLAFRSLTNAFALARTLRHEPGLIAELVRIACVAITLNNLEEFLSVQNYSMDQLAALSKILELAEADGNAGAFQAIVTERAILLSYFDLSTSRFINSFNPDGLPLNFTENLRITAYRLFSIRERDRRLFLEMMDRFSQAFTNDYPDALNLADEIDRDLDRRLTKGLARFAIVSPVLHSMHNIAGKEAALLTRIRCAQTAIAIERFRLDQNRALPETLDRLVPTYLAVLPRDPAEGQPLEFNKLTAGYQISSPAAARKLKNSRSCVFSVSE